MRSRRGRKSCIGVWKTQGSSFRKVSDNDENRNMIAGRGSRTGSRSSVGDDVYSSWFARMDLENVQRESVRLSVPTTFLRSWIQAHYAERVLTCCQAEMPEVHRIELTVRSAMRPAAPVKEAPVALEARRMEPANGRPMLELRSTASAPVSANHDALGGSPLDPRLTFASFVVGRSNTLAQAAARQVAEGRRGDPVMFNPLYIHAGVGLGKTHLLQAVTRAGDAAGERKVLYLTAEKFMYGFVAALKTQTALAFKEALRGIDVLVIDDLQFLQGKSTQAEFCHTLNALIDAGRQVVIAADRPPSDLESLDDRVFAARGRPCGRRTRSAWRNAPALQARQQAEVIDGSFHTRPSRGRSDRLTITSTAPRPLERPSRPAAGHCEADEPVNAARSMRGQLTGPRTNPSDEIEASSARAAHTSCSMGCSASTANAAEQHATEAEDDKT